MRSVSLLSNQRGETLITVMVAAGISAVLAVGAATQFSNMSKDQKRMSQKFEIMETRGLLTGFLTDIESCTCQLKNKKLVPSGNGTYELRGITQLNTSCLNTSQPIVKVNEKLPGSSGGVEVQSISLVGLKTTGLLHEYFGALSVDFKQASMIGTFAPARGPIIVLTNDQLEIQVCSSLNTVGGANNLNANLTGNNNLNGNNNGNSAVAGFLSPKTCQPNELFAGLDSSNKAICKPMPSCASQQMLVGFDNEGKAICKDLPTCNAGQIFSHINSEGRVVCYDNPNCPQGEVVTGLNGDGSVKCVAIPRQPAQDPTQPDPPKDPEVVKKPPEEPPPAAAPETKCAPGQVKVNDSCVQTYKVIDLVRSMTGGARVIAVGTYDRCVLRKRSGDLESTSYCELSNSGNSWSVRIEDEGNSSPLNCHITCTSKNTEEVSSYSAVGNLCATSNGPGIIVSGATCCSGTMNGQRFVTPPPQPCKSPYNGMAGANTGYTMMNGQNSNCTQGGIAGIIANQPRLTQYNNLKCQ